MSTQNRSTPELVEQARVYATTVHSRIDHRRKYSNQPYQKHLESVVKIVSSVSDDAEMLAAAWLHDTVEDTPATLEDLEQHFGAPVSRLVKELTDVSKPGDGNRVRRKAKDREFYASVSKRAKTIKLADLIDNCQDISQHDPRFATTYLHEMGLLLDVLHDADPQMLNRANESHAKCLRSIESEKAHYGSEEGHRNSSTINLLGVGDRSFRRTFAELFKARDIARILLSFDKGVTSEILLSAFTTQHCAVVGIREAGKICGFLRQADLETSQSTRQWRNFAPNQVLEGGASLTDVIHVLTRHEHCFITAYDEVTAYIGRQDINKPIVRMWLFGIISIAEMKLLQLIKKTYPENEWTRFLSEGRLQHAHDLQDERSRRGNHCELIECLQLSDKVQILMKDQDILESLGFDTKRTARKIVKEVESLRNHLAHSQDIVAHDWAQIARLAKRVDEITLQ